MTEIKLKPCPFCGGDKLELFNSDTRFWQVHCKDGYCDTYGPIIKDMGEGSREIQKWASGAWNRRPSQWIDVNDRLPKDNTVLLARDISGSVIESRFIKEPNEFISTSFVDGLKFNATHWMLTPELGRK